MASNEIPSNSVISPTCSICHKLYQDPVMLYCLHSFCRKCLEKYIDKEGIVNGKIRCPSCEEHSTLPSSGGTAGLPSNLRLSHLAEMMSYQNKMEHNVACERCTNNIAITFCANCCLFMCEACVQDHERWRELKGHEIFQLDLIKKMGSGNSLKIQHPPQVCQEHRREEMRFYCLDDEELVCRDCLMTTHDGHKRDYLEKVAENERRDLSEMTPNLMNALGMLDKAIAKGNEMKNKVSLSQEEAVSKIDAVCEELIQSVHVRQEILHERCKAIMHGKQIVLTKQIDEFEKLKDTIVFLNEQVSDAINNHSPEELLTVKKVIKSQVQKVMDNFSRYLLGLQENQLIATSLEIASLKNAIISLGHFPGVPEPEYCSIEGVGVKEAILGRERKFKVILKDEKNQALTGEALFQYSLVNKSAISESVPLPKVTITQLEHGTATLSVVPPVCGEYELSVMVRKSPLASCPFRMWVRPHRDYNTLPAQPTMIAVESTLSRGITVDHGTGKMYATDFDKNLIVVLNPDGSPNKQLGSNDNTVGNLTNPWGITVADNELLYVVSSGTHSVKIYDMGGGFVGEFGENGNGNEQLSSPRGITTDNRGHLLIADYENSRIQILTMKGKHIRTITCTSKPVDVAVDNDGFIHATLENNPIQIYAPDGTAGATYSGGNNPTGISIDCEGYKMITDASTNKLLIVDPENKLLDVQRDGVCWGVAQDSQGYVFASSVNNAQIFKF